MINVKPIDTTPLPVVKNISPQEEINKFLSLIPVDSPLKTEVGSIATSIFNINNGLLPNGESYPKGSILNPSTVMQKYTMETLVNKGFDVILQGNKDPVVGATKNFIISAIKNGEHVDVGSMAAAILPEDATKLLSKVLQTDIVGKDIFQLKDAAMKRLKDIQDNISNLKSMVQGYRDSISKVAATYGEIPEIANTLTSMDAMVEHVTELDGYMGEVTKVVEDKWETLTELSDTIEPTDHTTPTTPVNESPIPPEDVLNSPEPPPFDEDISEESEGVVSI